MKKLVVAALALALPAMPALAADVMIAVPPAPAPVALAPAVLAPWSGPYIGLHVGYGMGTERDDLDSLFTEVNRGGDTFALRGLIAGAHAGWNVQTGSLVFGVEGDFDWARLQGSAEVGYDFDFYVGTLSFRSDLQGSVRGRVGFVLDGGSLLYATAGIAFARGTLTQDMELKGPVSGSATNWHTGFTIGGGVEHRFTDTLSARLELRHTRFGTEEYAFELPLEGPVNVNFSQTTLTAGITLHF